MSFLTLDLETESNEYFGNVASPFHPDNYIVAPGWALDAGPGGRAGRGGQGRARKARRPASVRAQHARRRHASGQGDRHRRADDEVR